MRLPPTNWRYMACGLLLVAIVYAAGPVDSGRLQIDSAYHAGERVPFTVLEPGNRNAQLRVGPWLLGVRADDPKPRDRRRNLYVVFPGTLHRSPGWPDFDHNCVLSDLPASAEPVEWDVYWAVVLDPTLQEDFRSEQALVLADQSSFIPPDLLEFSDIPAAGFLRAQMKVRSLGDLARYRRKDGTLPRLLITPAGYAVR
ncbi:MAG: hypothetical protein WA463_08590, partial [Terriglobales bacterium]